MSTYSKLNVVYRLQKWMDSVAGQTFLNYAYSWGASIVILGTLFKLTHLPGANFFLFLGMGTEVFVFFISAFDRPFDKTTDGMNLDIHMDDENSGSTSTADDADVGSTDSEDDERYMPDSETLTLGDDEPASGFSQPAQGGAFGGGVVVIGTQGSGALGSDKAAAYRETEQGGAMLGGESLGGTMQGGTILGGESLGGTMQGGAMVIGGSQQMPDVTNAEELKEATNNYIDELNRLTEMLKQVSEQSQRLTRDSEEMENLNRTLTGISRVYEMQLKSASSQISTIDEINEQTRHMAEQIQELNKIYARMIEAMQVRANI